MEKLIAILKMVFNLIPLVQQGVDTIEAALPQGGQGAQKLELLKTWLQSALTSGTALEAEFEQLWKLVTPFVALYVASKKTAPAPAI